MKAWALGLTLAASIATGAAQAATVSGTFTIDVYHYDSGGDQNKAYATAGNVADHSADLVATVTYTGALDFLSHDQSSSPTISSFLTSNGGSIVSVTNVAGLGLGNLLSSGSYRATTLFDIKADAFDRILDGTGVIHHDDGITFYDDGGATGSYPQPTTQVATNYTFNGGQFRLVYAAANGDPSVLNVEGTVVPLPATALLLLSGLAGLLAMAGLKKNA
jgi:hypothetical protein